jgi:hypothetical protein
MAAPTTELPEASSRRWTAGRVFLALLVVAMVSMWVYVLYLAFGPGRQPPPDRLDDPAFATAAEARCQVALGEVAALPRAVDAGSAGDRADVVEQANESFSAMLDDLAALAPQGEDGELVRAWLADWRTYLDDRADYAEALRNDPEARLLVSPKDSQQVTEYLDAFAADNRMPACATPLDV